MSVFRELAEARLATSDEYARLDCGCFWGLMTRPHPCRVHRKEMAREWNAFIEGENEPEHEDDGSCCDPA